ncbi:MAG: hypothetical protein ACI936_003461, partial [Paraglaciecola sp.]
SLLCIVVNLFSSCHSNASTLSKYSVALTD